MLTVTGIGGVLLAEPRTVVTFGLVSRLRVSKVSTVTGIGGVLVAERRTVRTYVGQPGARGWGVVGFRAQDTRNDH